MKVKHEGVEYLIPNSIVLGARRTFRSRRGVRGMHIDSVRMFLHHRAAWCHPTPRISVAADLGEPVPRLTAERVCDKLGRKLVSEWFRSGYIERVRRGVYRLAKRGGK